MISILTVTPPNTQYTSGEKCTDLQIPQDVTQGVCGIRSLSVIPLSALQLRCPCNPRFYFSECLICLSDTVHWCIRHKKIWEISQMHSPDSIRKWISLYFPFSSTTSTTQVLSKCSNIWFIINGFCFLSAVGPLCTTWQMKRKKNKLRQTSRTKRMTWQWIRWSSCGRRWNLYPSLKR